MTDKERVESYPVSDWLTNRAGLEFLLELRAVEQALGEQAPSHASVSDKGVYPAASQYRRDRCGLF